MKIFERLSIQRLTQISNLSFIIGAILCLAGLFSLPIGLLYIAIAAVLFYIGSLANKAKSNKEQEEFEEKRDANRSEWENRSRMVMPENNDSLSENTSEAYQAMPFPHIPKKKTDKAEAARRLKQLYESYDLVNKTTKPDVFFGRLSFCFDCLLDLMTFKDKVFKDATPEEEYLRLYGNIESLVDEFVTRSHGAEYEKARQLKTEKGQRSRMEKYFANMYEAFSNASSCWTGNSNSPHYEGHLYTENNLTRLKQIETLTLSKLISNNN